PLRVEPAAALGEVLAGAGARRIWICLPGEESPPVQDLAGSGVPRPSLFLIGPEGGFTPQEARAAAEAGARPLGFPTPILRTPTAALLVASLGVWARLERLRSDGVERAEEPRDSS
ncbi:MAG: 16S rRNA (uracil(1498)-N(3))-methyltransferase, partial [Planctomycetes bacterium]|nr:16S rRNA (uracil(1498)-N(3))-methyltransferase [Planctomycetota bacterium]